MHSLLFSLESSLLAPLLEFALSSSGHVEPRRGLALGWLGSVVAGLAVVFGTADRAQANYCHGIPVGSSGWRSLNQPCWCPPPIREGVYYAEFYHYHGSNNPVYQTCNIIDGPVCYC